MSCQTEKDSLGRAVGVIPARWGSTRFPGKSVAEIGGKPLIQWAVERASTAQRLDSVVVATDDERIREVCEKMGADVVMTRSDHPSGTDRVAEAAAKVDAAVVVNIQGDEPLVSPELIDGIVDVLAGGDCWEMATAAVPIHTEEQLHDPSVVKVVWGEAGRALYFSRMPIPFIREKEDRDHLDELLYWRHIGIYGYQRAFLDRVVKEPQTLLEKAEKLEQLRALHLGARICVLQAETAGPGVDTPDDILRAENALREAGLIP